MCEVQMYLVPVIMVLFFVKNVKTKQNKINKIKESLHTLPIFF